MFSEASQKYLAKETKAASDVNVEMASGCRELVRRERRDSDKLKSSFNINTTQFNRKRSSEIIVTAV